MLKIKSTNAKVIGCTVDLSHDDVEARLERFLADVKSSFDNKPLNHIIFIAGEKLVGRKLMKSTSNTSVGYPWYYLQPLS